ncbi:lipase [Leptospira sp. GIMC2001]|uniref:lipase n=1 Tax=Leptospira sp. GIMC2001 TaxID=1513297 RepID=UPI00234B6FD6|nr:lipase [Leptospira sp. GIMC2001]WCL48893.1 lipase [Leptospira sp. GIMC2001]
MRKLIVFAFYTLLLVVLAEVGLRFVDPPSLSYYRNIKLLHRFHPDYYVSLGKNLDIYIRHFNGLWEGRFTTNSLGFRGSKEPDSNLPKLACLGDSLVMGFGVSDEDTFCSLLDGISFSGKKFQTQNLAVDAYGSLGSAKRLKESAEILELDTVLFFVSPNDFTVPPGLAEQGVQPDDITEKNREFDEDYKQKFHWQFELTYYSYFLQAAKLATEQISIKRHVASMEFLAEVNELQKPSQYLVDSFYRFPPNPPCSGELSSSSSKRTICPESLPQNINCLSNTPEAKNLDPLPEETIYAYNIMLEVAKQKNLRLLIVYMPVQNEDIRCNFHGKYSPLYDYAIRSKAWFTEQGIETIDLLEETKEICPIDEYYIPGDGHLTKKGNHWFAQTIKKRLTNLPRFTNQKSKNSLPNSKETLSPEINNSKPKGESNAL